MSNVDHYVADAVDDLIDDVKEQMIIDVKTEQGLVSYQDSINGETLWTKAC
jgi:osmotically-inducible protein OsmY